MSEYIKREDVIKVINDLSCYGYVEVETDGIIDDMNNIPAADVVERKVVRWIAYYENDRPYLWSCENCGAFGIISFKYCPNCGAKMEGNTNEE